MAFAGTTRPPARWHHAHTQLRDFALVSYAVEPARLQRALPPGFEIELFSEGSDRFGLVSAVPFLDRHFYFRWMPLVRINCGQVNYRAYVRRGDQRGVWFFGTSLDTWLVAWPRWRWRMPWHRDRICITAAWDDHAMRSWSLAVDGEWGTARCTLATDAGDRPVAGFRDRDHLVDVLCHPLVGWFARTDRGIASYSVWHEPLDPIACAVEDARFDVFERLDIVSPGAAAHSAFVQRDVVFDVHTPPRRLSLPPSRARP